MSDLSPVNMGLNNIALKSLDSGLDVNKPLSGPQGGTQGQGFAEKLKSLETGFQEPLGLKSQVAGLKSLRFSNHAVERMQLRGVHFSPDEMQKIENAVSRASAKGAKETLLLTDKAALIVSIKDKTVVTVMDKSNLKENVFTNIDSTVVI